MFTVLERGASSLVVVDASTMETVLEQPVATPIGYPTNLMVMGPGGYRFVDYLRFGGPLTLLIGGMSVALIPVFWPF